jgi:hypothetical protein
VFNGRNSHEDDLESYRHCNDNCEIAHRSCMPRRLLQVLLPSNDIFDIDDSPPSCQDKLQSSQNMAVLREGTKQLRFIDSNRLLSSLHLLNCWNGGKFVEHRHWDSTIFVDTEISMTSESVIVSESLSSPTSTDDLRTKKEVTWADDEGMNLFLIHYLVPHHAFLLERIEI